MARTRTRRGSSQPAHRRGELGETIGAIRQRYGDRSVRLAREINQPLRISTGAFILDFALLGGLPFNRASLVAGERHAGKSMLASKAIAAAQMFMPEHTPVVIDVEGTFEASFAGKLGVDLDHLPIMECETGEMAADIADAMIQTAETSLVVVDSIGAMLPIKEAEGSAEDANVALQARLVQNMVKRNQASLIKERKRGHFVTILYISQFRTKIGGFSPHGDPRVILGGKAMEYCTSLQMIIKNKENKGRDKATGVEGVEFNEHSFTIVKNKLNQGPRNGQFDLIRMDGVHDLHEGDVDDAHTILTYAKKFNMYGGGGQRWTLEFDDESYQVRKADEAITMLREDPEMKWRLRTAVIRAQAQHLGMPDHFIETIGVRNIDEVEFT